VSLVVTLYTDPACPFAFSAEPVRWRLRWHYGDGLAWRVRMIVLTREPGEAEKLASGAPSLQRLYGMPIDPAPHTRPASSEAACRLVVAARLRAPQHADALLRRLRVRTMRGGLLDDPALLEGAAREAGLDAVALARWSAADDVAEALERDARDARRPPAAARALDHKLGGPGHERRYTAPSYEIARADGSRTVSIPGFNPPEVYEAAIANLAPDLPRRARPASVEELLAWAGEPLATAEIAMVVQADPQAVRAKLAQVARAEPAGADCYWTIG
jgi:2-hydroxychromene-2-carboxylate isomerase